MSEELTPAQLKALAGRAISQPLVGHIYTADPSAHVFDGRIYVYPSHDIEAGIPFNDEGDHFGMQDYHVLRLDSPEGEAVDCGVALHIKDVPWAERQMWAPDIACRDGRYYFYFPAKRADGIFQIGVAVGDIPRPSSPTRTITGSYSIDPAAFTDDDGECYLYFGGPLGRELQKYRDNRHDHAHAEPSDGQPALGRRGPARCGDEAVCRSAARMSIVDDSDCRCGPTTTRAGISKARGCTSTRGAITCPIRPVTRIFSVMRLATIPTAPLSTRRAVEASGRLDHAPFHLRIPEAVVPVLPRRDPVGGITHLRSVKVTELHYDAQGGIQTSTRMGADPQLPGAMSPLGPDR